MSGKGWVKCMYKIAVIGDYDSIYGFSSLGLAVFPVSGKEEAAELFPRLAEEGYGVIYITEKLAGELQEEIDAYNSRIAPAVVCIPGISGNTRQGAARIRSFVERAVGSDLS